MKKFVQDLIVTAIGTASSVVISLFLFLIREHFQFSRFQWFVIIVGPILLLFVIGVFGSLYSRPYCEKCSRYLSGVGTQTRFASDPDAFALMVQQLVTLFDAGRLQEAINQHTTFGKLKHSKELSLRSMLELKRCRGCGVNWLGFSAHKQTRDDWKEINSLAFARFGREGLKLPG